MRFTQGFKGSAGLEATTIFVLRVVSNVVYDSLLSFSLVGVKGSSDVVGVDWIGLDWDGLS